ncbi:hypothetical protein HSHS1_12280 [Helicobacter suis HS1]|nr:hypothetical protein HSHS1_12280 [Helicobacter suis HS1]
MSKKNTLQFESGEGLDQKILDGIEMQDRQELLRLLNEFILQINSGYSS